MPRYIAFLRAINVGGHTVKMDRLRTLFEELGFNNVETFIASGNVIFAARSTKSATLETKIERHLFEALGYEVTTFLRTAGELSAIAAQQPFTPEQHANPNNNLYIAFLPAAPTAEAAQKVLACRNQVDEFAVLDREVYWLRSTNLSDPAHPGPALDKLLGMPLTLRNSTTVRKMAAKYASEAPEQKAK